MVETTLRLADHHGQSTVVTALDTKWSIASLLIEENVEDNGACLLFPIGPETSVERSDPNGLHVLNRQLSTDDWDILLGKFCLGALSEREELDFPHPTIESSMVASESDGYDSSDEFNANPQAAVGSESSSGMNQYSPPIRENSSNCMTMHRYGEFIIQTLGYQESLRTVYCDGDQLNVRPVEFISNDPSGPNNHTR